jgi:hypothetical protein
MRDRSRHFGDQPFFHVEPMPALLNRDKNLRRQLCGPDGDAGPFVSSSIVTTVRRRRKGGWQRRCRGEIGV